jgi:hypothetical protein
MLLRAFGPADAPAGAPVEGGFDQASGFGLASRIAGRHGQAKLAGEVGAEEAQAFAQRRLASVAAEMRFHATAARARAVAEQEDLPLAFLKGFALRLSGLAAGGTRPSGDLDLLAAEDRVEALHRAMVAAGFRPSGMPEMEHQLPTLVAPTGDAVELHRCLLGVRLPGSRRSATFAALQAAGLLEPARGCPGHFVPAREVLLAHAAVHALVQHGYTPDAYPPLRLVADWLDLGAAEPDFAAELPRVAALVAQEVPVGWRWG